MNGSQAHFNNGYFLDEEAIKIIRDFHKNNEPPYLISELSKQFGVKGVYTARMPVNISGCIRKEKGGSMKFY